MAGGKSKRCPTAEELLGGVEDLYTPLSTNSFDPYPIPGTEFEQPQEDPVDGIDVWRCSICKLLYGASDPRNEDNICENCKK